MPSRRQRVGARKTPQGREALRGCLAVTVPLIRRPDREPYLLIERVTLFSQAFQVRRPANRGGVVVITALLHCLESFLDLLLRANVHRRPSRESPFDCAGYPSAHGR